MKITGGNINLGFGVESTRGTAVAPAIWLAGRTPAGLNVVNDKALIKETTGNRAGSAGSVIVEQRAEGDFEFNLKNTSFAYLAYALLGSNTITSPEAGVHKHEIKLNSQPQTPSLTMALSRAGVQDYQYPLSVISSLEVNIASDDIVNGSVSILSQKENAVADYTPAFGTDDYYFPHQFSTVKIADDVAGLAGASAVCIQEASLSFNNNSSARRCVSDTNIKDVVSTSMEAGGSFTVDYDTDFYHEIYKTGASKAIEVTLENTDVTIGASSHPTITFTFPNVTFEGLSEDRPIDDLVTEGIDFTAHYDNDTATNVIVTVINETSSL